VPDISLEGVMLAVTAMTLGRSLLNIAEYETSNDASHSRGLHVYDHSLTPVLNESFCAKFEMVVLLTEALSVLSPKENMIAVGCGMPAMNDSQPYWLSQG
jgi:hypothetical protein